MEIGIIGAGIGGLATAIRLAVKGHEVTVYEKNSKPGGKISELHFNNYRFDTGPSLFTLPELVDELFALCGESVDKWLPYESLSNNCEYFFSDGTVFNFYQDKKLLAHEVATKTSDTIESLKKRLDKSQEVYELSAPVFIFRPFARKLSDFNTPPYKKIATQLYKLDFLRTMNQANKSDFKDQNLVQLFNRYATYNGSNPYKAPATLNMIAHLENNIGAYFPLKGMYSIVESLYKLAMKKGIQFHLETPVQSIEIENKEAVGVIVNNELKRYDIVISDADVRYIANNLISDYPLRKRLNRSELSSSALIFYWGINKTFDELELHNILFSGDYKTEFKKLFKDKIIYDDPTVYIFISSKLVKGDAPKGCENWFVMINAPANNGQYTEEFISKVRRNIINKINHHLHTDIEKYIVGGKVVSPLSIEANTNSLDGALYGVSSNSMFSAFRRHLNSLKKIQNLYFVGGSVHPGGGIPLCLASAKIVDDEITAAYE